MRITQFRIKNFRSIWQKDQCPKFQMELGQGINYLIGPNNCGKSNILRALNIAFHDGTGAYFNMNTDNPSVLSHSRPMIEIHFEKNTSNSPELTLLRYAKEYEDKLRKGASTFSEKGELRWIVQYSKSGRDDKIAISGKGGIKGDTDLNDRVVKQLKSACHFIYMPSGQGIEELYKGAFQNILRSVLEEHLREQLKDANNTRKVYLEKIKQDLLSPLQDIIGKRLNTIIPEIHSVQVNPSIPNIDKQIAQASISIADHFETELEQKGTGVRSTTLIALLDYIKTKSRRSIVFAIEEPETFLHPGAQAKLVGHLEKLADRRDVTVLITTHSPFILSPRVDSRYHMIRKNLDGLTIIAESQDGEEGINNAIDPLFDDRITARLVSRMQEYNPQKRGYLLVEGYTDLQYMQLACAKNNRQDLIDDLQIIPCYGTGKLILKAVFLKSILPDDQTSKKPLFILVDFDENGKAVLDTLIGNTFKFRPNMSTSYKSFYEDTNTNTWVEAEDLFENTFVAEFLESNPSFETERVLRSNGKHHYGISDEGKEHFLKFVEELPPSAFSNWLSLLEEVRKRMNLN